MCPLYATLSLWCLNIFIFITRAILWKHLPLKSCCSWMPNLKMFCMNGQKLALLRRTLTLNIYFFFWVMHICFSIVSMSCSSLLFWSSELCPGTENMFWGLRYLEISIYFYFSTGLAYKTLPWKLHKYLNHRIKLL